MERDAPHDLVVGKTLLEHDAVHSKDASYAEQERLPPWTIHDIRWPMAIYISVCHLLALAGIFMIPWCKVATLLWTVTLWPVGGFGITGGAHRLWAHRSYKASFAFRAITLLCNSIANQGTVYHWARDHRTHHFHSETCADPHDAGRGFFFAHMGWLFLKKDPRVIEAGRKINMDDLKADSLVMLQLRSDPWWNSTWAFLVPALVARAAWGESLLLGIFVPGFLRYVWLLHCTWCVNSVAHLWGERPYDEAINPAENRLVTLLAIGEGWHNWHHKYPFDYAASEFGVSSQFNPTKLAIDFGAALGMVSDRKRATAMWAREKAKRRAEAKTKDQ
jgi:stearoyl-CoA desaturase (delta-9 desaturase)